MLGACRFDVNPMCRWADPTVAMVATAAMFGCKPIATLRRYLPFETIRTASPETEPTVRVVDAMERARLSWSLGCLRARSSSTMKRMRS